MHDVNHISDHDLERYYLGMVKDAVELAVLEEHLLTCPACVERAEFTQNYVDALRAGLVALRKD
jgi:anti-sigma factor RsiW